ncbi:LADA_0D05798g1_1 [Lachancea dasiensis]|uniref:Cyclin-dependent kinase 8 n=1 Tax=Lachancea dasiensis TaxID=1072105 RepID=A0A1G4J5V3_9SACH|nr:LADA_0D05798g1_1 [Lachancea dasiensis]
MYGAQSQGSNFYHHPQGSSQSTWQQQMSDSKGATSNSGKPLLMANNSIFSIGPYKRRKDANRVSVVEKYEIIGYIAAGTYGKVYKARKKSSGRDSPPSSLTDNESSVPVSLNQPLDGNDALDINSINKSTRVPDSSAPSVPNNQPQGTNADHKSQPSAQIPHGSNVSNSIILGSPTKKLPSLYAIKKFKTEREGVEQLHYTGISQSACREMSLCRELRNKHLTHLVEIFLEHKSIYMVSEFAEHDLLQIIHFHSHPEKRLIPPKMLKSIVWQILDGVSYLHQNWILHRDLKPANIMVTVDGCVKIGDLGLARKFHNMVQTLYTGDKVVVTIWYRAPELLLGARHYTPAIDLWAVGCIFAELIGLRPIFKGEEAKMDSKKSVPFQGNQLQRILEVLGSPNENSWPDIHKYPECEHLSKFPRYRDNLPVWYHSAGGRNKDALDLLYQLLRYDPITRVDAVDALEHSYFTNDAPTVSENVFEGLNYNYPPRRIHTNDNDIMNVTNPNAKSTASHTQSMASKNVGNSSLGGLGVNKRILAAAAAAAAAVSGNNSSTRAGSSTAANGPLRKKRK